MRYRVRGVHRDSGKVIDQTVEAPSADVLRARAEAKGVTVVAIDPVEEPGAIVETRPVEPPPAPLPAIPLQAGHVAGAPVINVVPPKRSSSMGTASIVLGVLAFLICWIPGVGILGIPLSGLGLLLAIGGVIVALTRGGSAIGLPIAGGAVSALALAIGCGQVLVIRSMAQRMARNDEPTPVQAVPSGTGSTASSIGPSEDPGKGPPPAERQSTQPLRAFHEEAVIGDAKISVKSAAMGKVSLRSKFSPGREGVSEDALLAITITVTNSSESKKLDYATVADTSLLQDGVALLSDNFGNNYKRITFGTSEPVGRQVRESLYPGASIEDVLVFEVPISRAEHLFLKLPGTRFGSEGHFVFALDAADITGR